MNILFLTSRFPFPPIGGDRIRPYWFIRELSQRHKIHLLSFAQAGEIDGIEREVKSRIKVSVVRHSRVASCFKTAINIFRRQPLQVSYYYYQAMQRRLNQILKQEKIDLIFIHLLRMAKYVQGLQVNKIIDFSDSFGLLYTRSLQVRKGLFKLVDAIERNRMNKFEKSCLSVFDNLIIASKIDKQWIETGTGLRKIKTVTNGIELPKLGQLKPLNLKTKDIAFIGNMRSFANSHAVIYFARHIFPLIKRRIKDARFCVIGAGPPGHLKEFLKDKQIQVTGRVGDVDEYLKRCAVAVAPMISCSGVQNKILKYMSLRIPTVATQAALGDLEAVADRDIVIADGPQAFARGVIWLLEDEQKRSTISENGYRYVLAKHNWQEIIAELENSLINKQ